MITLTHGWLAALALFSVWLAVRGWRRHRAARRVKAAMRVAQIRYWGHNERARWEIMRAEGYSVAEIAQAEEDAK